MRRFPASLGLLSVLLFNLVLSAEPPPAEWSTLPIQQGVWRGNPVEYRLWQGWGLIDGDMLIELPDTYKSPDRGAVIIVGDRYRWPDAVVVYKLDPALRDPGRVTRAFQHWEQRTLIRFQQRTDERAYVTIRSVDSGCSSNVGMLGNEQFVNLADGCSLGNTIHELGHTIGLFHTQSRLDRDRYLRVRYDNITRPEWSQYIQRLSDGFDSGPYDYGSIMHYAITGFTSNYGASMESSPPGIPMGQRSVLSPEDIQAVNLLYQRPLEKVTVTTTPPGLTVEVDGAACTTPCEYPWAAGEQHTIHTVPQQTLGETLNSRYDYVRWSDLGEREHQITVDAASRVYNAHFARKVRIRSAVSPEQGGVIEIIPYSADGWYPYGSTVSIRALPNEGWRLYRMLPGAGGVTVQGASGLGLSANPSTILVTNENLYYVASFTQQRLTTIATEPEGRRVIANGTTVIGPTNFFWSPTLAFDFAVPDPQPTTAPVYRYTFDRWANDGDTFKARFRTFFQISLGSRTIQVKPAPDPEAFLEAGTQVEVRAVPDPGLTFTNWTGDFGGTGVLTFPVDDAYLIGANFNQLANLMVHDATLRPGPIAPGEILAVFSPQAQSITFDGEPARILERREDRLRVLAPALPASQRSTLVTVDGRSATFSIVASSPGIYTNGTGAGEVYSTGPAVRGESFSFYASGFEPSMLNRVIVGELDAEIEAAEALGDGAARVSIRIPAALARGKQPVFLAAGGPYSPPGVYLTIQ